VIDIGANIGDTVAYIRNYSDVPILCIDGNEDYLAILRENIKQYNSISVCHCLVGAETKETNVELKTERGTAFITEGATKNIVKTLQDILSEFPDFQDSKILKIDTDGYDGLILKGCTSYLKKYTPILFFEFDPFLFNSNNDDPFTLIPYLKDCGYRYLMFYMSNGDYLVSCDIEEDNGIIEELVHFFSGRNVTLYTDICAFSEKDKAIFEYSVKEEIKHFRKVRKY
jgi:FkbM family methyltransferase